MRSDAPQDLLFAGSFAFDRIAEFLAPSKAALAKRVGFRCSLPGCSAVTLGLSEEGPESSSNTATACHIYAATDGPPAARALMLDRQRNLDVRQAWKDHR